MEIVLRKFNDNDIDFVMNNWVGTDKLDGLFKDRTRESLEVSFKKYQEEKSGDRFIYSYCIELEFRPVGIIQFTEKYKGTPNLNLYIEDIYRNKGIGTKAFELGKEIIKSKGYKLITSSCGQNNIASVNLHKKLGFDMVKVELSPNGTPMYRWQLKILN